MTTQATEQGPPGPSFGTVDLSLPRFFTGSFKRKSIDSVATRWTPALAQQWTPVSNYFLENYTRLRSPVAGQRSLNPTEAMLLIQLVSFKNGARNPYPSAKTLAKRLGMSDRAVRTALGELEARGLITRIPNEGRANAFDLSGLFKSLETLMSLDAAAAGLAAATMNNLAAVAGGQ